MAKNPAWYPFGPGGRRWIGKWILLVGMGLLPATAPAHLAAPGVMEDAERERHFREATALPGARQFGVGCAFFANVPALTYVSGIHVADRSPESRAFITSVYGLRRGDFLLHRAFDKQIFYELFGMKARGTTVYYPDAANKELITRAGKMITGVFEDALNRGEFISLRVYGELGMPHNVLLVAHRDGRYLVHDPTTGSIRTLGLPGLASRMLTESKKGTRNKKRYFSSYHRVTLERNGVPSMKPLSLGQLPEALELRLAAGQLKAVAESLKPKGDPAPGGMDALAKAYPAIDFAVLEKETKGGTTLVSVIDKELPAADLKGLAQISKLAVNSYQIGSRDLLPVWFDGSQPRVVIGYAAAAGETGPALVLHDGLQKQVLPLVEALKAIKRSGPVFGYVSVPRK
ncbi:hypothetical protein [Luteolibacter marinus]|uniref:hypothetical protein n=1 Tax=Luteolibacter marinus TaxID=2776705 RepID=UPI001867D96B|nr:hypothetical protein [Luteolibacter marinus]